MEDGIGERVRDAAGMVRAVSPRLVPGVFTFRTVSDVDAARLLSEARAMVVEDEGVSLVLPSAADDPLAKRQITLDVQPALDGVGLTTALAGQGIPCNVVARHHHDHVFGPAREAERALDVLRRLADGGTE
jgi:hypothetical protein